MAQLMAVIYDLNLTLLKVKVRPKPSIVARRLGITNDQYLQARQLGGYDLDVAFELGLTAPARMREVLANLQKIGAINPPIPQSAIELAALEADETIELAALYPGALATLRANKAMGLKQGLCSNGNPYGQAVAKGLGLLDPAIIDASVFSYEIGLRKPIPKIYFEICHRLHVRPENALYASDGEDLDLVAAASLGMRTAFIENEGPDETIKADYYPGPIARLPELVRSLL